ncbi:hypothetical protein BAY61_20570 [Prauserella marina]|uniref:Uncharacterized protein n=1 Tax=Prauserella marina TaxID=530584 RepID=A0A222VSU0_9PSEU|nr:hypothetical protein [Prauserella marina]ASR36978.1 hypothetical protein BAY61_20570 [Prauserella marina]PWV80057.1 hypothetical protein DES30_103143 [Prauserella marina]SDD84131.1 hypothetical protein SAMN05421630_11374 [Prauserella marina]
MQAEQIHNSTVNINAATPPEVKFGYARQLLHEGNAYLARELIRDVLKAGFTTGIVQFHWVLATLSTRSLRDLEPHEQRDLNRLLANQNTTGDDWARALQAIQALLEVQRKPGYDPSPAMAKLDALDERLQAQIRKHLQVVLTGAVKEEIWTRMRADAEREQFANNRENRVWAYFYPQPAAARVRTPDEPDVTTRDRLHAIAMSSLAVLAVTYLGWLVLEQPALLAAFVATIAAGYVAVANGLEWCRRVRLCNLRDRDYHTQRGVKWLPDKGFASEIDSAFEYYAHKYTHGDSHQEQWLASTRGIRTMRRNEIVELYREERISAEQVKWLIRYIVGDLRDRWKRGALMEHRERYRVARFTKIWFAAAVTVFLGTGGVVITAAAHIQPVFAAFAAVITVVSGSFALKQWLHITCEHLRFAEDTEEFARVKAERIAAHDRWRNKLKKARPAEKEMETWLNADTTLLLDETLRHYSLSWNDIITYSYLRTPKTGSKRSRRHRGPSRASQYDVRIWLITVDGVREVHSDLNFEKASFMGRSRTNFRFDTVSSVGVKTPDQLSYTLELTLNNGPARPITITDTGQQHHRPDENPTELSRTNLAATGFTHTLRVLEGIAAEGKGWISRHANTTGDRATL